MLFTSTVARLLTLFQNILMDELLRKILRKWVENQMRHQPREVGISSSGSSWRPRGYPRVSSEAVLVQN